MTFLVVSPVQATVIFDWVCFDSAACNPGIGQVLEGKIAFADAGFAAGSSSNNASGTLVESFTFNSTIVGTDPGAGPWTLGTLVTSLAGLQWSFSASGDEITLLNHPSSFFSNTWEFETGAEFLNVGADSIEDVGNFTARGAWLRRS